MPAARSKRSTSQLSSNARSRTSDWSYPDTVATLRALRYAGLRVGICSNASYRAASMHEQLRHTGLDTLIDSAVFSAEVGWRKPSPRLFTAALASLGASAAHTVFVGDRMREDIVGASRAGMRTVLVARDQSAAHGRQQDGPDAVITSLSELPALLLAGVVVTIVGAEN